MSNTKVPCKDCKNRKIGCHSTCDEYKAFSEYNKKKLEEKHNAQAVTAVLNGYNKNKQGGVKVNSYR